VPLPVPVPVPVPVPDHSSLPRPGSPRAWLLATRPATLLAALAPIAVGSAVAHAEGGFAAGPALAALAGALLLQIASNLWNDASDFERGADTADRLGPTRAAAAGLLSPRALRAGVAVCFAAALACGVYLTARAGWPVVAIGLCSMAAALAYTGGPYPLGYHGLGDLFVVIFFGEVAVAGTAFVQLGHLPGWALVAGLPVGALATAILVVNNLRDRSTDRAAGKRTLVVRFGAGFARAEYAALLVIAFAVPLALAAWRGPWLLLPLAAAPLALHRLRQIARRDGAELNPSLKATAQLLLVHGLLFAAGIATAGAA
jgi:1,4-dihydroxy-2-naphthoate polyprenyltransferase